MPLRPSTIALLTSFVALTACQGITFTGGQSVSSTSMSVASSSSSPRTCGEIDFAQDGTMETWNTEPATEMIEIDRPNLGFSVTIPYNPSWGSPDLHCTLTEFDEWSVAGEEGVQFGFAHVFEGGGVTRFNVIAAVPARSAEEALEAARTEQERSDLPLPPSATPTILTINGNTVVRHGSTGLCDETYFEVIGKNRNYVVRSVCDIDADGRQTALETLVLY